MFQRATATITPAAAASTWSCTNCRAASLAGCASNAATSPPAATATTAGRATTETPPSPSPTGRPANVSTHTPALCLSALAMLIRAASLSSFCIMCVCAVEPSGGQTFLDPLEPKGERRGLSGHSSSLDGGLNKMLIYGPATAPKHVLIWIYLCIILFFIHWIGGWNVVDQIFIELSITGLLIVSSLA